MMEFVKEGGVNVIREIAVGLLFLLVLSAGMSGMMKASYSRGEWRKNAEKYWNRRMNKVKNGLWYERNALWLKQNGAGFHFGDWINPLNFLLIRLGIGLAGMTVFSMMSVWYGAAAMTVLYYLPVGLVLYMNNQDNLKMLPELKHLYHSLEIQTRAGVYITDALAEVYGSVQEKRLKQSLLDLAGDIVMRADLGEALERFQSKFDNNYIDSLCMIILQAMESGQSIDLLSDLSEQIKDMEAAVLERKKEAMDRSITFYQLGILVAVLGLVLYACVSQMFAAAVGF